MGEPLPVFRDGKQVLRNQQGDLVQVAPEQAAKFLADGTLRPVAPGEVKAADEHARLTTPAAKLGVGLRATAEAVGAPINWAVQKLGGADIYSHDLTPEQIAENKAMEEANPGAKMVGETVGQIAGLKGFGIARGAGAVGGKVAAATGSKVLGAAASTGLEFGAMGASSAMENPDATIEDVLSQGGMSALLGAGLGGGGALLGKGLGVAENRVRGLFGGKATSELGQQAEQAIEQTATRAPSAATKAYNESVSALTGAPKELLEEVGAGGRRTQEAIHAYKNLPEILDRSALEMQPVFSDASKAVDDAMEVVRNKALKAHEIEKLGGSGWSTPERLKAAEFMGKAAADDISAITEQIPEAINRGKLRTEFQTLAREAAQKTEALAGSENAAQSYVDAYTLKQSMQKRVITIGKDIKLQLQSGRITSGEADVMRGIQQSLEQSQERLRQGLMDHGVWGSKVASATHDVNDLLHDGGIQALKEFRKTFLRETGEEGYLDAFKATEADPARIKQALSSMGTSEGFISDRAMKEYADTVRKTVETIGKRYDLDPAGKAAVKTALEKIDAMSAKFAAVSDQVALGNKFARVQQFESQASPLLGSAGLAGAVLGGIPGALVGGAVSAAARPASTAMAINALAGARNRILGGLGAWIENGARTVAKAGKAAKPAAAMASLAGMSAANQLFIGKHKNSTEAYQERVKSVLQADISQVGQHTTDMPPEVQLGAGSKAAIAIDFLKQQIPAYARDPSPLAPGKKVLANEYERTQFAKAWATVADPTTAIKDLRAGRMTPIQAQALRTVYPSLYDSIRYTVVKGIGKADAAGITIPIYQRQQLDTLLDLGGAGEPAFAPEFAGKIQQGLATQNQARRKGIAPSHKQPQSVGMVSPVMRGLGVS
jgi:hypothetical protein